MNRRKSVREVSAPSIGVLEGVSYYVQSKNVAALRAGGSHRTTRSERLVHQALEIHLRHRPGVGEVAGIRHRFLHDLRDHLATDSGLRQPPREAAGPSQVIDQLGA